MLVYYCFTYATFSVFNLTNGELTECINIFLYKTYPF